MVRASVARRPAPAEPAGNALDRTIDEAAAWLTQRQADDGHWVFELEADATIPSDYIMLNHFLDEINDPVEQKLAAYLRRRQGKHGGWSLFYDGDVDLSASVRAYFALKLVGDDPDAPHMQRAREVILARGGAAKANVFTRFHLVLFGQMPWRAVPVMPVETMLLPKWAPFHLEKVSYWSRCSMVPMFVLYALKPRAVNPRGIDISELFVQTPEDVASYQVNPTGRWMGDALLMVDSALRAIEPARLTPVQKVGIRAAVRFIKRRLNGRDGLGAIFPPMANSRMMFSALGYSRDHPTCRVIRESIDKLLVLREDEGYAQPCVSPVWDTALAAHALLESGAEGSDPTIARACAWLRDRQILDVKGDWAARRPHLRPGGWAFQYRNDHYPDVDDTAVVVLGLHRADGKTNSVAIDRGTEWVLGMQSRNGGWGAFDVDNEYHFLNNIPFADHGALLDPPTADVTARCLGMLAQVGYSRSDPAVARAIAYLQREQEADGSWFGRWGTNYIYGTWSVLSALNAAGEDMNAPYIRRAVDWLKSRQRPDGGWGEDCASYWPERRGEVKTSTASHTAWALLALMAAGEVQSGAVSQGVDYLLAAPRDGGKWREDYYNAVGFPKVFYLMYHGYSAYFPLWALARYRNLRNSNSQRPAFGI